MRTGLAKIVILSLALAMAAVGGAEEFLSLQNVYSPPESGRSSQNGMWMAPGAFGGVRGSGGGFGFGMSPGAGPSMPYGETSDPANFEEAQQMQGFQMNVPYPYSNMQNGAENLPLPASKDCAYTTIVKGLGSSRNSQDGQFRNGTMAQAGDVRADQALITLREQQLAQVDSERRLSKERNRRELERLETRRRTLESERSSLRTSSSSAAFGAEVDERTIAIDQSIVDLDFQIQQIRSAEENEDFFFYSRRQGIESQTQQIHPVLNSVYRNQEAISGNGSLRPFVRDLVSYVSFSVGGPAGLVIGSTVSTLLGGGIDKALTKVKEALSKPEPRIEELVPLIQEVCRWRKFNQDTARSLADEKTREDRRKAREELSAKLDRAENHLNACAKKAELISGELSQLEALIPAISNRVKQGKLSLKAEWALITDLPIPEAIKQRLRETEDSTVAGLLQELNRARLSRSQFVRAYSRDAVQLNLGLLEQIRKSATSSMGNLSPDDSLQLQMILLASSNRLKAGELELQRKLVAALDTEKTSTIAELKKTYKEGTPALTGALIEVELPYVRAMRQLHERHNALQREAADQEKALLSVLELEKRLLKQEQDRSPLKVQAAPIDPALERKLAP
ncbi:MAG: hypothetical protein NDJ90_10195 [Oligoflexia bacterium]|nr:hypothetical protein [Oligoflexia bacterium]